MTLVNFQTYKKQLAILSVNFYMEILLLPVIDTLCKIIYFHNVFYFSGHYYYVAQRVPIVSTILPFIPFFRGQTEDTGRISPGTKLYQIFVCVTKV